MLRSLIAGALLLLTSAAPALADVPPFPFTSISDVIQYGIQDTTATACPGTDLAVSIVYTAEIDGLRFKIISTAKRDVFIRVFNDEATHAYFVETIEHMALRVVRAMTITDAKVAYPAGPCGFFQEVQAGR